MNEDAVKTLRQLKDMSSEEDLIIEQLDIMEKNLDRYLEIADKKDNSFSNNNRDYLYNTTSEISKTLDSVQKDVEEVENRIFQPIQKQMENLKTLTYENDKLKDNVTVDVLLEIKFLEKRFN